VQSNFAVAQANVKSAQISVDKARKNLAYTEIYAPIDGVVVERNVDVGQTVAASLSAPQLFLIANDLSEMQILASVDESDIGQITEGLPVEFTVQSYANRTFKGTVKQVRLQSTTVNNVVSYTAVVGVSNEDGKLLPGMTATVKFVTGQAEGALTVPNAALRFKPAGWTPPTRPNGANGAPGAAGAQQSAGSGPPAGFGGQGGTPGAGMQRPQGATGGAPGSRGMVFTQGPDGKPVAHRVKLGITDGQRTVIEAEGLAEAGQIITGVNTGSQTAAGAPSANPLAPQAQQQGARRGPPSAF
jgi:HlyD family secretion protein